MKKSEIIYAYISGVLVTLLIVLGILQKDSFPRIMSMICALVISAAVDCTAYYQPDRRETLYTPHKRNVCTGAFRNDALPPKPYDRRYRTCRKTA